MPSPAVAKFQLKHVDFNWLQFSQGDFLPDKHPGVCSHVCKHWIYRKLGTKKFSFSESKKVENPSIPEITKNLPGRLKSKFKHYQDNEAMKDKLNKKEYRQIRRKKVWEGFINKGTPGKSVYKDFIEHCQEWILDHTIVQNESQAFCFQISLASRVSKKGHAQALELSMGQLHFMEPNIGEYMIPFPSAEDFFYNKFANDLWELMAPFNYDVYQIEVYFVK